MVRQLRSLEPGARLVAELGREPTICYGDVREGVVQDDGAVVLQRDRPGPANAARLGHLLHHLVFGLPFDEAEARTGGLACGDLAKNAAEAERAAHGLENQLRQAFGLPPIVYQELAAEYEQRCQTLRQAPK